MSSVFLAACGLLIFAALCPPAAGSLLPLPSHPDNEPFVPEDKPLGKRGGAFGIRWTEPLLPEECLVAPASAATDAASVAAFCSSAPPRAAGVDLVPKDDPISLSEAPRTEEQTQGEEQAPAEEQTQAEEQAPAERQRFGQTLLGRIFRVLAQLGALVAALRIAMTQAATAFAEWHRLGPERPQSAPRSGGAATASERSRERRERRERGAAATAVSSGAGRR